MKRKRLTKMQLYQIIQEAQNNLVASTPYVNSTNQNGSNKIKTPKTTNREKSQKETPYPVNNVINQYVNSILQKKKLKEKEMASNEVTQAVPLNSNWNSLSLGTEMYDSLFSFTVNTPQVWYDPLVWNIIYAALPTGYTMPDPAFMNILRTITARELMKPISLDVQTLFNTLSPKDE